MKKIAAIEILMIATALLAIISCMLQIKNKQLEIDNLETINTQITETQRAVETRKLQKHDALIIKIPETQQESKYVCTYFIDAFKTNPTNVEIEDECKKVFMDEMIRSAK